jgi:EmrB/QacA subfamily drug resistance transporter
MKGSPDKNTILFIITLSSFLTPFMGSVSGICLPSIGKEFNMNAITLSWVATSYLLASAIFLLPIGKIADIVGRKTVFLTGMTIFTLASLLTGFASTVFLLIFYRVLQGIGSAMIFGTSIAIISCVFPEKERGKALGISVAAVYLGLSLGPIIGGFFTEHFGWRSPFFLVVPVGLLCVILGILKMKDQWADAKGEKIDYLGSIIYSATILLLMLGVSFLPENKGIYLIASGTVCFGLFIWWQIKTPTPIIDFKLFKGNRIFVFSNLAAFINYSATFSITFLLSLYLQYIKQLNPLQAGMIMISQPIVQVLVSPYAGKLSDKIEPGIVASIGMALTVVGLIILTFINNETNVLLIEASLITLGAGFGLFSSPNTNAIMSSVDKKLYGVASGTLGTMRLIGQMFSMGIVMMIFAFYMGKVKITPDKYEMFLLSIKIIFAILSALCILGIFASVARGKVVKVKEE